jgi:glycosyltransferase involved in cell wall biosynthesis
MVTACFEPVVNGVTRMISLSRRVLTSLGHEVTIFTLGYPGGLEEGGGVIRSSAIPLRAGYYITPRYGRTARDRMAEMDIVHCHHLMMGVDMARRYSRSPIVFTNHSRYDHYLNAYLRIPMPLARRLMRRVWPHYTSLVDTVIAPSASICEHLKALGVRKSIEVIPNGIDLNPFLCPEGRLTRPNLQLTEDSLVGIYVGRLSPEKSVDLLLKQFDRARSLAPRLRLIVVGDGDQRRRLEAQARRARIEPWVLFAGRVPPEAVPDYLALADFFVTASPSEVHPLTVVEAMAVGLPVVGPRAPGLSDIVRHGVNGLLDSGEGTGLVHHMVSLAGDEDLRVRMGEAARRTSLKYDVKVHVEKTLALYKRLIAARGDV